MKMPMDVRFVERHQVGVAGPVDQVEEAGVSA
jgi:hypothetical protein